MVKVTAAQTVRAEELDLSAMRAHCRDNHKFRTGEKVPRSNMDLAAWHARQHWRYGSSLAHIHRGPLTYVLRNRTSTTGQIARPLGWFTGDGVVTRAQLREEFHARLKVIHDSHAVSD